MPPYPCRWCDQKFNRIDLRWQHIRNSHQERCVACEFCDALFLDEERKTLHIKSLRGPFTVKCTKCPRRFCEGNDTGLKNHTCLHYPASKHKYTCRDCGKRFVTFSYYSDHRQKHFKHQTPPIVNKKISLPLEIKPITHLEPAPLLVESFIPGKYFWHEIAVP